MYKKVLIYNQIFYNMNYRIKFKHLKIIRKYLRKPHTQKTIFSLKKIQITSLYFSKRSFSIEDNFSVFVSDDRSNP